MNLDYGSRRGWSYVDVALYLVGVAGLSASLTILWLGMRAVMGVGGYCAEGGPYVIAQHCPEGTALLLPLAVFAGLGSAGLMGWEGSKLGSPWSSLVGLAWPALFISLGFNFLQFGLFPPEGIDGLQVGWLIPGFLFVIMGAVPLIGFLPGGKNWKSTGSDSTFAFADPQADSEDALQERREQLVNELVEHANTTARAAETDRVKAGSTTTSNGGDPTDPDLVTRLERLDALHRSGGLTYDEFHKAKAALLAEAGKS